MTITSKQRAYLRSLAMTQKPIFHIGKGGLTRELTVSIDDALEARELIKLGVLKTCEEDVGQLAETIAGRTRSLVIQTMGKKITLYRPSKKPKIELPRQSST